ncbi:MAG TPA: hypothetical protein VI386_11395 [Candidatus Sulfotelmatobacter sp.]
MQSQAYNSAILKKNLANRLFPGARFCALYLCFYFLFNTYAAGFPAVNWSEPEQQLAAKIVAITGPGAVALTIENKSSLDKRESEIVSNGLRAALEALGLRYVPAESAAASVAITLSENQSSFVWVAQVRQSAGEPAIVMVSMSRAPTRVLPHDSVPLTLRKLPLWRQQERILDVVVLEEGDSPIRIAVLDGEKLTFLRSQGARWEMEQSLPISHTQPWPRDLRGRLVPAKDHLLDVYLPGVMCHTSSGIPPTLNCGQRDDPWPLVGRPLSPGTASKIDSSFGPNGGSVSTGSPLNAFFAPARNFFNGVVSPRIGKFGAVPPFYSTAFVSRDKYVLWLFAGVDGHIHMIDGISDLTSSTGWQKTPWGSDIASVRTACGAGWQVLAVSAADGDKPQDSVRAYELPDRDPVAVSAAVEFPGSLTALWTEPKGDSAIVVVQHRETGEYEAFRVDVACGQ